MTTTHPGVNPQSSDAEVRAWLIGRLPASWFVEPPSVALDREEITVIGRIPEAALSDDAADSERAAAGHGRAQAFREDTREERMAIARDLEHQTGRKVAWGVTVTGVDAPILFTHLAVPVMTRLRQPERMVLDTLVDAGVARSRADALAWCVRLVGEHSQDWLTQLRAALGDVERVRRAGP